ncbi:DUF3592 domain-containing protein [Streptomyces sp. NPDC051018]|uniref:DUF3592 domain-containing protein n=1 Tax=Streptomyces sp. NPDC051018 TaxID=3365639 RepID=UPI0037A3F50B
MTAEAVLGWFFAVVLALVALGAAAEVRRRFRLARRGVAAEATVVAFTVRRDTDGTPRHFPVVTFTLADGSTVEAESPTGTPHTPADGVGDRLGIVYDPRAPRKITVTSLDPGHTGCGMITAMVICAAGAAYGSFALTGELLSR